MIQILEEMRRLDISLLHLFFFLVGALWTHELIRFFRMLLRVPLFLRNSGSSGFYEVRRFRPCLRLRRFLGDVLGLDDWTSSASCFRFYALWLCYRYDLSCYRFTMYHCAFEQWFRCLETVLGLRKRSDLLLFAFSRPPTSWYVYSAIR